jgi:hypothetical protein
MKNGYAYEHMIEAEKILGRRLLPGELVHHEGPKSDNARIKIVPSIAAHKAKHRKPGSKLRLPGEDNPLIPCACGCGGTFAKYDDNGRPRKLITGHNRSGWKKNPPVWVNCTCGCGTRMLNRDESGRLRRFVSGHNKPKRWVNKCKSSMSREVGPENIVPLP